MEISYILTNSSIIRVGEHDVTSIDALTKDDCILDDISLPTLRVKDNDCEFEEDGIFDSYNMTDVIAYEIIYSYSNEHSNKHIIPHNEVLKVNY